MISHSENEEESKEALEMNQKLSGLLTKLYKKIPNEIKWEILNFTIGEEFLNLFLVDKGFEIHSHNENFWKVMIKREFGKFYPEKFLKEKKNYFNDDFLIYLRKEFYTICWRKDLNDFEIPLPKNKEVILDNRAKNNEIYIQLEGEEGVGRKSMINIMQGMLFPKEKETIIDKKTFYLILDTNSGTKKDFPLLPNENMRLDVIFCGKIFDDCGGMVEHYHYKGVDGVILLFDKRKNDFQEIIEKAKRINSLSHGEASFVVCGTFDDEKEEISEDTLSKALSLANVYNTRVFFCSNKTKKNLKEILYFTIRKVMRFHHQKIFKMFNEYKRILEKQKTGKISSYEALELPKYEKRFKNRLKEEEEEKEEKEKSSKVCLIQ